MDRSPQRTVLSLDYRPVVDQLRHNMESIATRQGQHFDLAPVLEHIGLLAPILERSMNSRSALDGDTSSTARLNMALRQTGRPLIPVDYSKSGKFDHELAVPNQAILGLQPAVARSSMDSGEWSIPVPSHPSGA